MNSDIIIIKKNILYENFSVDSIPIWGTIGVHMEYILCSFFQQIITFWIKLKGSWNWCMVKATDLTWWHKWNSEMSCKKDWTCSKVLGYIQCVLSFVPSLDVSSPYPNYRIQDILWYWYLALIAKIQGYANKCTLLKYTDFTIKH